MMVLQIRFEISGRRPKKKNQRFAGGSDFGGCI